MPSKNKKGKSKGKQVATRPTENEVLLQAELDKKVRELADIKLRVRTAKEENNWLNEQANKVRIETNEYKHFMLKKTNLRQTQIVTLTDYHRQQIHDIHRDKEYMLKEYQQKKEELRLQSIRKQQLLVKEKHDLETMNQYKIVQEQQNDKLQRLQDEIIRIRNEHVNELSCMKLNFEKEIQQQRTDQDTKIQEIQQKANQDAEQYIYDRTLNIQDENVQLRKTLQDIVKRIDILNEFKQHLEEEQIHLIHRMKLARDLKKIRLDKLSSFITK